MKGVIAVVMLAVGVVLGFTAGLLIRDPSVISHPRTLFQDNAPRPCLQVIASAEEISKVNGEYLALVRESYLPMLQQQHAQEAPESAGAPAVPSTSPAVDAMLAASQRLADLSDRTAQASAKLNQSKVECRSRVDQ